MGRSVSAMGGYAIAINIYVDQRPRINHLCLLPNMDIGHTIEMIVLT